MLTFAWFLLKVTMCIGILFGYYLIALRNKKFHQYNRYYLLLSVALSWLIPLMKIDFTAKPEAPTQVVQLLSVVASGDRYVQFVASQPQPAMDWSLLVYAAFALISAVLLTRLLIGIVRIKLLISRSTKNKMDDIYFVLTNAKGTPFSFFRYIFWNENISLESSEGQHILKHELAHVHEKHSADKLFVSLALVLGWFNPFMWLIKKELNIIHEFIADRKAIDEGDTAAFASMILKAAYSPHSFPLSNSFFYSPIKRRLLMLTSSKNTRFTYLRRVAILPLLVITCALFAFNLKQQKVTKSEGKSAVSNGTQTKAALAETAYNPAVNDKTIEEAYIDTPIKRKSATAEFRGTIDNIRIITVDTFGKEHKVEYIRDKNDSATISFSRQLFVVDGEIMTGKKFEEMDMKPELIKHITVLKGEAAAAKYGDKARNGVVEISTSVEGTSASLATITLDKPAYPRVFTRVENPQYYADGMMAFADYINRNIQYPKQALQHQIDGAVSIQFIVNEEGKLTDFKKLSDKGYGLEEEAIRLIKSSGEWKAGIQNGHKVPVQIEQQVIFKLPAQL